MENTVQYQLTNLTKSEISRNRQEMLRGYKGEDVKMFAEISKRLEQKELYLKSLPEDK